MSKATPKLIIHGGIGTKNSHEETKKVTQEALKEIAESAHSYLLKHSALEAVIEATRLLEDHPRFNAGTGSVIQSDGVIRMTASLMDGAKKTFSGVINIEMVQNPVLVAKILQGEKDRVLSGKEAMMFARKRGFKEYNPETPEARRKFEKRLSEFPPTGTVGCVAIDSKGNLAAATSTGGKGWEIAGRVSDSSTVAGNYANKYAAISCTGVGENIVEHAVAATIAAKIECGESLGKAGNKMIKDLKEAKTTVGFIALDHQGNTGIFKTHDTMSYAIHDGKLTLFK